MTIVAVGHRGTGLGVPQNSIISHDTAYAMGARGIEFDIRLSKDGEFVVFHDADLDKRTTGEGDVKDKTIAQLKAVNLLYDGEPTDHKIPTLSEALANVGGRFMVDLDFKDGPDNAEDILRQTLASASFDKDDAPLVKIFCRDKEDYNKVKGLNDLYRVRPLYDDKKQAAQMARDGIKIMGLRNKQFTVKRASRIRREQMNIFYNAMEGSLTDTWRDVRGLSRKKPKLKTLLSYYQSAIEGGAMFIQTDFVSDLVTFLKQQNLYQDQVLDRNFQPLKSSSSEPKIS